MSRGVSTLKDATSLSFIDFKLVDNARRPGITACPAYKQLNNDLGLFLGRIPVFSLRGT